MSSAQCRMPLKKQHATEVKGESIVVILRSIRAYLPRQGGSASCGVFSRSRRSFCSPQRLSIPLEFVEGLARVLGNIKCTSSTEAWSVWTSLDQSLSHIIHSMIRKLADKLQSRRPREQEVHDSRPRLPGNHPIRDRQQHFAATIGPVPTKRDIYRHRKQIGVNIGISRL